MAVPWILQGSRVLDIGCHQGEFLKSIETNMKRTTGIDPLATPRCSAKTDILNEKFEDELPFPDASFDVIVMLATIEHILPKERLATECARVLAKPGRVVMTVPSVAVDRIVHLLCKCGLAHGMSLDEHHGFAPETSVRIFSEAGFSLKRHRRFQLGLNNLYVFDLCEGAEC